MTRAANTEVDEPPLYECGWDENGDIVWVEEAFPANVEDILLRDSLNEEDLLELHPEEEEHFYGDKGESDDDDNDN